MNLSKLSLDELIATCAQTEMKPVHTLEIPVRPVRESILSILKVRVETGPFVNILFWPTYSFHAVAHDKMDYWVGRNQAWRLWNLI